LKSILCLCQSSMCMFYSHEMDFCQCIYFLKIFDFKLICLKMEFQKHVQYRRKHQSITTQSINQSVRVNAVFLPACFSCKRNKFCVIFKIKLELTLLTGYWWTLEERRFSRKKFISPCMWLELNSFVILEDTSSLATMWQKSLQHIRIQILS